MAINYVVRETTVRETGESAVFPLGESLKQSLILTLGITHAMQQESLDVDIYGSADGRTWAATPLVRFRQMFFCGTYQMDLPASDAKYLKATWRMDRWSRSASRPFFRFYLSVESDRLRVLAGAA